MKKFNFLHLALLIAFVPVFYAFKAIVPEKNSAHLFKIDRNKDTHQIFYDLNVLPSNKLDVGNPINIYWIRDGKVEPLTWVQKKYAYGLNYLKKNENEAVFQFVSYNKRNLQIKKDAKGVFHVFTMSNNKLVKVNRIFLQIEGGSFWVPKITRVELHGEDARTSEKVVEIINP